MHRLSPRLTRLENRMLVPGTIPPWTTSRWQWLSESAKMQAVERYLATLSDSELEALLAEAEAQAGDTLSPS